jgi:hypothetical protein
MQKNNSFDPEPPRLESASKLVDMCSKYDPDSLVTSIARGVAFVADLVYVPYTKLRNYIHTGDFNNYQRRQE